MALGGKNNNDMLIYAGGGIAISMSVSLIIQLVVPFYYEKRM